jgi:hypothetical protein
VLRVLCNVKEGAMSRDIEQHVDTNSAEFKQGVEAGLNAGKDMKNWKAGNELGLELKFRMTSQCLKAFLRNPRLRFLCVIVPKVIRETLRMKRMKLRNSCSAAATEREKFLMH